MATISRLSVSVTAKTSALKKGLRSASNSVKKFGKSLLNVKGLIAGALGAAAIGSVIKGSLEAFKIQEQAVKALETSLVSMNRTTKNLSSNLQKLASQIQNEGVIGDEAILQGASFLATYGEITDRLMPRTIRAMVDLAAKTGGTTTNAANLLGKASMGLVGALSIAGISLSEATKKSKDFEAILGEIEQQVGGMNRAMGDTASGAITQFGNALGDLKERLGGVIAIAVGPFFRLLSQTIGATTADVALMAEQFRSWIIDTSKRLAVFADIWVAIQAVINAVKTAIFGVAFGITATINAVAKGLNFLERSFGRAAIVGSNEMEFLQDMQDRFGSAMDKSNDKLFDRIDLLKKIVGLESDSTAATPSTKIGIAIDEFAIAAGVAEMKQRLGLTGGPNFRTDAVQAPKAGGPEARKDPQLETTNSHLSEIRDFLRFQNDNRGAFAQ